MCAFRYISETHAIKIFSGISASPYDLQGVLRTPFTYSNNIQKQTNLEEHLWRDDASCITLAFNYSY